MLSTLTAQSVFDMPKLFPQHRQYLSQFMGALQRRDLLSAETAARSAVKLFPNDPNWNYNVACVCAIDGRPEEALTWLQKAIECGFSNLRQLKEDPDLAVLRQQPAYIEMLQRAEAQQHAATTHPPLRAALAVPVALGSELTISAKNTQWNWDPVQGGYMTTLLNLNRQNVSQANTYNGPYADQIRQWIEEGTAAGNAGDIYVNRDEDRTQIVVENFPLLTSAVYGDEAQIARAHVGIANGLFSSGLSSYPVVGNSVLSLANTAFWRSLPRLIATETAADQLSFRLAALNQLYIYDATPDYSAQLKGDLLTAAMPQVILSCGKTPAQEDVKVANEQLTELVLAGLAAMHPETKQEMLRKGLLVQTIQQLLRKSVKGAAEYCSVAAHPMAFNVDQIDGKTFITEAHALTKATLPAVFQIVARRETMPRQYIDYFDAPTSERLTDTPWSIKRVVRGVEKTRKLTVSALSLESGLTYQWFVTNGDPKKVRIRSLTKDASLATIEVDYHGAFDQKGMPSRHVDIACVAMRKGVPASAPLFVSFRYLANERRTYAEDGKILQVDYTAPETGFVYEDPALTAFKNWKDDYIYDANRRLQGWKRTLADGSVQQFDAQGRRILEMDAEGRATRVVEVKYYPRTDAQSNAVTSPVIELFSMDTDRILTF